MNTKNISRISAKSDKNSVFKIEKDFSINNVDQVKKELQELVEKYSNITLVIKNVDNFDLSAIQLLHGLKLKLGNSFNYTIEVKEEINTIINHSGFDYLLNK
jgi:MFS superfamily sulfate permease-like transporter